MIRSSATSPLPPLVPSPPLLLPSTTHRDDIPEEDMPLQKRACFTTPTSRFEVGESSSTAAARQTGRTLAHRVDYGFIDTIDASIRASKSRAMTIMGERRDTFARWLLLMSVRLLMPVGHRLTLRAGARELVRTTEAGPQDRPADAGSSCYGNGDDSHDSGSGRRTERATRECTYSNLLKCKPINFKGSEGVVSLTQWFEKMESVFDISNYTVACQIKFATCTLLGNALTRWNSHIKIVGHDVAYRMPWKTLKKMMTD
ncbi:hypothetical protein Tco_1044044 [Tanacetum coccineum]|uniref:Reverse transcriptase domain-containing protein n=1 Tax=Tanacetum coccineum TaxID=301880 RepID=A0ABQ5GPC3_9ASTR